MSTQNTQHRDDEFDIEDFARKIYRVSGRAAYKLSYPFRLMFARPLFLLLFVLTGTTAALMLYFTLTPVYKSSFILRPGNPGDLTVINILHDLEELTEGRDNEVLSMELDLETATAEKIDCINSNIVWTTRLKDSLKLIEVEMWLTDPYLFDSLEASIINYLETNDHYERYRRLRQMDIEGMKAKVNSDLAQIDSLKRQLANSYSPRGGQGFVYGEAPDAVKVYASSLELYKQKLSLNWQEEYNSSFEVVKSSIPTTQASRPNIWWLLGICVLISLVACVLFNLIISKKGILV